VDGEARSLGQTVTRGTAVEGDADARQWWTLAAESGSLKAEAKPEPERADG